MPLRTKYIAHNEGPHPTKGNPMDNLWLVYVLVTLNILMLLALTATSIFAYFYFQDLQEITKSKVELRKEVKAWQDLIGSAKDEADVTVRSYDYPDHE